MASVMGFSSILRKNMVNIEPKSAHKDSGEPPPKNADIQDMLTKALGKASDAIRRAECLEMALKIGGHNRASDVIEAAEAFHKYIMGGKT